MKTKQEEFLDACGTGRFGFLSEKEVALLIRKSVSFLQRQRWTGGKGVIPFYKIGHHVRYDVEDVKKWLKETAQRCTSTRQYKHKNQEEK